MADEFFRASFTTGIFAERHPLSETLGVTSSMLGNNLSQLGVDAAQLGDSIDTFSRCARCGRRTASSSTASATLSKARTLQSARFGSAFHLQSNEDRQSQPGQEDPENSIIRLSDGTPLFQPNAFNTGGRINEARYQYAGGRRGCQEERPGRLEGEYYFRCAWITS